MCAKNETNFLLSKQDFKPAYLELYRSGELQQRANEAVQSLKNCLACPRDCGVDRLAGETAVCKTGRFAVVSSSFAHMGEEDCLRGWRGSGTIFFANCNLRCVFCQNYDISQLGRGTPLPPEHLAALMLNLQAAGCHNINFVTPEHVVPQIIEALPIAAAAGLRLPIVYNTSAYDSMHSLRLLDGIADIYMPDFKFWDTDRSLRYLKAKDYPEAARRALREMHRQVGPLRLDEDGIAKRGVLVRHLIMPKDAAQTGEIMRFLANELSTDTYVNLMDQYRPTAKVSSERYADINRPITALEYKQAQQVAQQSGLWRLDQRRPQTGVQHL